MSTVTGKTRGSRPDNRGGTKRKAEEKATNKTCAVQDLRVTRLQRGERKERLVQGEFGHTKSKKDKLIRALNKKVAAIERLTEQAEAGDVELNDDQVAKIGALGDILDKLEKLVGPPRAVESKEDGGEEDDEEEEEEEEEMHERELVDRRRKKKAKGKKKEKSG